MTDPTPADARKVLSSHGHASPSVQHHVPSANAPNSFFELSRTLYAEYARTVATVGCEGVDAFLLTDLVAWSER
jgi:hypothetical protein